MKPKDLIFLDLDGTILDYKFRAYKSFLAVLDQHRMSNFTFEQYVQQRRTGVSNFELYSTVSSYPIDSTSFDLKWQSLIEDARLLNYDQLFPDTLNWVRTHIQRANLVLCTARRNKVNLLYQLQHLGVDTYFKEILISEGKMSKYELLNSYLENPNNSYAEMYFLGDTRYDMLAGKSVGAKVIFIERGFTSSLILADTPVDAKSFHLPDIPY